jgi:DNA-binding protein HU-beta
VQRDGDGCAAGYDACVTGIRRRLVNKQELIAKIVKDTGLTKVSATGAVESLLDGIKKSLKKGNGVTFVGFGSFQTSMRKARTARNPQTGAAVKVPKRRVVRFKAGKALKDSVN